MINKENSARQLSIRQCYASSQSAEKMSIALKKQGIEQPSESVFRAYRNGTEMCFTYWDEFRKRSLLGQSNQSTLESFIELNNQYDEMLEMQRSWASTEMISFTLGCQFAIATSISLLQTASQSIPQTISSVSP